MDSDGIVMEVEKRKFLKLMQRNSIHSMRIKIENQRKLTGNSYYDISEAIELDMDEINVIKPLGSGCFGDVYLCEDLNSLDDQNLIAVKAIDKVENEEEQQVKIVVEVILYSILMKFFIAREKHPADDKAPVYLTI